MMGGFSLEDWLTSGIGTLIVGSVGYFIRALTERSHAREIQELEHRHEDAMQKSTNDHAKELEQLNHQLTELRDQAATRFTQLHERRVQAVMAIQKQFVKYRREFGRTVQRFGLFTTDAEFDNHGAALNEHFLDLTDLATEHHFVFTEEQAKLLLDLVNAVGQSTNAVFNHFKDVRTKDVDAKKMIAEIEAMVKPADDLLSKQFRAMVSLG